MKKILLIISIIILALAASTNAYASSFPDIGKDTYLEKSAGLLSSYGIVDGYPDGTFKPDQAVTRAEMAKIVIIAAGYNEYSKNMTSVYEDMHGHWAESYVELANVLNIVNGISPTTYGPDNLIKFEEAYTMIIRLLGYNDESLPGPWPPNYFEKANELNLFKNIDTSSEFATRGDISIMLYNALDCNLVKIGYNNAIYNTNKTLMSLLGSKETKEITLNDLKIENFDFTDYLFNKWDVYYNIDGNAVYADNPRYNEFKGTVTSLLTNRVIFVTDDYGNVRAFQLPEIPIVINGEKGTFNNLGDSLIKVVYEDNSFNGDVIGIIAYKATDVKVIERDDLYKLESKVFAGKNLPTTCNYELNFNKLHIYGDASSLEEIKENDVVYFYETKESNIVTALTLLVFKSQITGIATDVQTVNNITYYTVNNIRYKTGENFIFTEKASINDKVNLILDKNNNIIKLNILDYGKYPSTLGIVISSANSTNGYSTAKILDEYGVLKSYFLADNSGVVNVVESGSDLLKQTSLKKNDIVKFDPVTSGTLKIIDYAPTKYIATNFNSQNNTLSNGNWISQDTFIVYEKDGKYQLLEPNQLDSYLEGKALIGFNGYAEALYLNKGIKTTSYVTVTPEISQSYNGTIYGIIKGVTKIDDTTNRVQFFNDSNVFSVSNSSAAGKKIPSVLNSYVKAVVVNGIIIDIDKVTPETERIKITQLYSNQMLIDGITYMEYATDTIVYNCTTDDSGNITSFKLGLKSDLNSGSTAQLYDLYGKFDGIIDVVLLFN
ncbi:MAG: S-layer homology domain-containing protein [Sedimentibacter sp.]|uniref:S-layer homology domain-containing protein n=1 Tax=Sedimentibacter sp. TaxID=1960295 RepID=UPI002981C4D3|nr:S-layer homology domain-containing protein [Sedimentibacter sp.]MDW5300003.1 S-layer homology domain-containing protein [Sedimentibacter sp.]